MKRISALVVASLTLSGSEKTDLLDLLPRMSDSQLDALIGIFEGDRQRTLELVKEVLKVSPEFGTELNKNLTKRTQEMAKILKTEEKHAASEETILKNLE